MEIVLADDGLLTAAAPGKYVAQHLNAGVSTSILPSLTFTEYRFST